MKPSIIDYSHITNEQALEYVKANVGGFRKRNSLPPLGLHLHSQLDENTYMIKQFYNEQEQDLIRESNKDVIEFNISLCPKYQWELTCFTGAGYIYSAELLLINEDGTPTEVCKLMVAIDEILEN